MPTHLHTHTQVTVHNHLPAHNCTFTFCCCSFVASANLHEGAIVANYPFDGYADHSERLTGKRHPAPDDAAFQYLAKLYAKKHSFMAKSQVGRHGIVINPCCRWQLRALQVSAALTCREAPASRLPLLTHLYHLIFYI